MPPKFGTSGLRGLVTELTPGLVAAHVAAFARGCETGTGLFVGRDLRASSPDLARTVAAAARVHGLAVTDCGAVPTPALALAAMAAGAAAVMVTGSHIPADRNGLKFYTPRGEITKEEEAAILAALGPEAEPVPQPVPQPVPAPPAGAAREAGSTTGPDLGPQPGPQPGGEVGRAWVARVTRAFGPQALAGLRVGIWEHSSVARDALAEAVAEMGAEPVPFGRSEAFVPVDTEAVDAQTRAMLASEAAARSLDAVISTDGDGDRPLLTDAAGRIVPGDVIGQIAAARLGAGTVVTPVSSNGGAEAGGRFARVIRTRIGSPHVIAAMEAAMAAGAAGGVRVAGYEANGGFLLGFTAQGPGGPLPPLMTRDSLLPIAAMLAEAREAGGVGARVAAEPARFTAADRLAEVPTEASAALIGTLDADDGARAAFLAGLGAEPAGAGAIDRTDGLRMGLRMRQGGERILHLRPSGNAPELRIYAEADSPEAADALLSAARETLSARLGGGRPGG